MSVSTAMSTQFKADLLNGAHCFGAPATVTATASSGATAFSSVSSVAGIAVGMAATGTNVASGSVVASVDSSTAMTLSKATTGSISAGSVTLTGDVFKIALIKTTPGGTWDATAVNIGTPGTGSPTVSNLGTDETSGTGYTSGGSTLTQSSAVTSGTTAYVDFADVSWSGASFSCTGAIIYNSSKRLAGTSGQIVSTHSIGDTTVTAGTLTLVFPNPDASNAIIRLQ